MTNFNINFRESKPIYHGRKVIGSVSGNTFRKNIYFSRHSLRCPPALALSINSIVQAENMGAKRVEIHDTENQITYIAEIEKIRRFGFYIERGGFEKQIALTLDRWDLNNQNDEHASQLKFWGGNG